VPGALFCAIGVGAVGIGIIIIAGAAVTVAEAVCAHVYGGVFVDPWNRERSYDIMLDILMFESPKSKLTSLPNIDRMCSTASFRRIRVSPEENDVCFVLGNDGGDFGTDMAGHASATVDVNECLFFDPEFVFHVPTESVSRWVSR
jgi:hypothetical protein